MCGFSLSIYPLHMRSFPPRTYNCSLVLNDACQVRNATKENNKCATSRRERNVAGAF